MSNNNSCLNLKNIYLSFGDEFKMKKPVWQMVIEAVENLGGKATNSEIKSYIKENYGDVNDGTIYGQTCTLTVNHNSRVHHINKNPRDANSKYDRLFKTKTGEVELYDPEKHGKWEITRNKNGELTVNYFNPDHRGRAHIVRDICYLISKNEIPSEKDLYGLLKEKVADETYWKAYFQNCQKENCPKYNLDSARSLNLVQNDRLKLTKLGEELVEQIDPNELFTYNYSLGVKRFFYKIALEDNIVKQSMEILKERKELRFFAPTCNRTNKVVWKFNEETYRCEEKKYPECSRCDRVLTEHIKETSLPFETFKETGKRSGFVFWMCSRITPMHLTGNEPVYSGNYIYWDDEAENELKMENTKIKYFVEKLLRSYSLNLKRGLKAVERNFGSYLTELANYYSTSFESEVFEGDQPYFILYNGHDTEKYMDYPYFIAYFFKKRSNECYLTLNTNRRYLSTILGNEGKFSGYYNDKFERILSNLSSSLRSELPENSFSDKMNLYSSEDPKWFSLLKHGTICARKYDLDNLSSEEELESDFRDILDFYNNLDVYSEEDLDVNEFEPSHVDTAKDSDVMPENFFEYLSEKGYFFEQELVENFLLSLKVKPFVIMTGNSGTGKTKLAQLFAQFKNSQRNPGKIDKLSIDVDITTLSKRRFGEWDIGEKEYEMLKDFCDDLTLEIHGDRSKSPIRGRGYLKGYKLYYEPGTPFYDEIESIKVGSRTRIYVMAENYGKSENYEVVPVGANWTENRHIVGFYNVITEEYEKTPALDLILNANNIAEANFLILDEMNLSHVERYFSDFLSAMESGEKIPLHQNDEIKFPKEIEKLPENLCIIGTVNVDETTYMFSPKVLDRANTIEFLTPSALDYMNGWRASNNHNGNLNYLENPLSDLEIRQSLILDIKELFEDVQTLGGRFWDVVSAEIFRFQELLKKAGFDFGFRVINEIMRFMYVSWVYEGKPQEWKNWKRYFDAQIKQKMLPRIHGSQRTLEGVLKDLYDLCSDYPSSKVKLEEMKDVLYKQRYVSFTN